MNNLRDVNALQGDPLAEMNDDEWAADMTRQLLKMTIERRWETVLNMTDDERDMIARLHGTGTREQLEAAS